MVGGVVVGVVGSTGVGGLSAGGVVVGGVVLGGELPGGCGVCVPVLSPMSAVAGCSSRTQPASASTSASVASSARRREAQYACAALESIVVFHGDSPNSLRRVYWPMQYTAVSANTRFMLRLLASKLFAIVCTACRSAAPFGVR